MFGDFLATLDYQRIKAYKSYVYHDYPVVRREPRSEGYSYSLLNGEPVGATNGVFQSPNR